MSDPREDAPNLESGVLARVTRRLVAFSFLCYVVAYIDRVNVGFVSGVLQRELSLSNQAYGFGAGLFFFGYFLFEIPSNLILERVGARLWIARIMIVWGFVSMAMLFVTGERSFYAMRFLLGLAEAGFFPGIVLYLTYWIPARERAKSGALFMMAAPVAILIGAPLSEAMLRLDGRLGLAGWQWLFLGEGVPAVVLGVAILAYLDNGIAAARWLTAEEKDLLARQIAADQKEVAARSLLDGFTTPRVWLLSAIYFCLIAGLYGSGFWLPTLIKRTGVESPFAIGMLTVVPNAAATVAMVAISRRSDAARERRWHLVTPALIGALGWVLTVLYGANTVIALGGMTLAMIGVTTSIAQFWCLPTAMLAGAAAATGIALINSIGNLAGFASPWVIGWISDRTHSTDLGVYALAASMCLGSLLVLTLPRRIVNR